jgi:ketosteroid isomerase-like protein
MKSVHNFIVFLAIPLVSFAINCSVQVEMDNDNGKEALLQTDREFSEYSVAHGAAEAFNNYLLEEAFQLPAGQNPIYGRDGIYQSMLEDDETYTLSWEPQNGAVASSNDMGWTWGIYTITFKTEKGEVSRQGKYLNVWEKDDEGNWRVLIDMGNQNPANPANPALPASGSPDPRPLTTG